jgi:tetratricopeptide (TPR) repeat protein
MITAIRIAGITLWLGIGLAAFPLDAAADSAATASCSFAAGRDVTNNTVTCNLGLTPEELKQATQAATSGGASVAGPCSFVAGRNISNNTIICNFITVVSQKLGVTEEAAKTLLRIVGEDPGVPDDKIAEALIRVATDYKQLQAQVAALNPENPTARDLVKQATIEIEAGHLGHAHELLRQATQAQVAAAQEADKLLQQAQAAKDAQLLGAAGSTATEGDVALTERHYTQAAELYRQAVGYVPDGHIDVRRRYLGQEANALYRQGDERGDNVAALQAIERYQALLRAADRAAYPPQWAETQNNLGIALETLGERESGVTHLQEAVAAYRAALEEWRRDRVPLAWAQTQNNLGVALGRLGERESGTAHLQEAVAAFRAALEERARERVPLAWAETQNNLGIVLGKLGERESGTAHLQEAVAAYRAVLVEWRRDRVPLDWATTQNNLGTALEALGERESGTAHLQEAVAAYRAALEERTRERVPLAWAATQNNLGIALETLGERESCVSACNFDPLSRGIGVQN